MKKDTNNNVEVIARLLSDMQAEHNCLPLGLHIQQDNTSRECKNQHMVNFTAKLVALGVFQWVTLAYLITGHTHENLDGTFGQLTVKLSALEFDSDTEVLVILHRLLGDLGIDRASRNAAKAYKLDEAADWQEWWGETGLSLSRLTGPDAPHWFHVCRLKDMGETDVPLTSVPGMPPPLPDDVVMVVKERMASVSAHQVLRLLPANACQNLVRVQPRGLHSRRAGGEEVKAKVARVAKDLLAKGVIQPAAHDYLVGWAEGTGERHARPLTYSFLEVRPQLDRPAAGPVRWGRGALRVQVQVRGLSGGLLPLEHEPDGGEAEPGELIEADGRE
jgi:hypothetical protein